MASTSPYLVSIITAMHNSAAYVGDTIQSVQQQRWSNWEMIIVDDCSEDNSAAIVRAFAQADHRIKLLENQSNLGPALTRNRAIEAAKGRFIAFLDSDDLWTPDKLERQINFMIDNQYSFTYTYYTQMKEDGTYLKDIKNMPLKVTYESTMRSNKIGCLTAVYDVDFFDKTYMANIEKRQDYTVWLQLLRKTTYAYCVPYILAHYRVRKGSISSNKLKLIKYHWYIYREIEKSTIFKSAFYISYYIISRVFRK